MKPTASSLRTVIVALVAASAAITLQPGCAAGVATYAHVRGDLDATLEANLEKPLVATNKAIEQLKFAKVGEKSDALQVISIVRNASDKKIEINLQKASDHVSKLKTRVGIFGDEPLSLAILDKIKANL